MSMAEVVQWESWCWGVEEPCHLVHKMFSFYRPELQTHETGLVLFCSCAWCGSATPTPRSLEALKLSPNFAPQWHLFPLETLCFPDEVAPSHMLAKI